MFKIFEKLSEVWPESLLEELAGHHVKELIVGFSGNVAANLVAAGLASALVLTGGYLGVREIPARIKARTIRRNHKSRLTILLARIEGEGGRDIRDRIHEQMDKVFGEDADRLFAIEQLPVALREIESGDLSKNEARTVKTARKWLARADGDLLIWGRARQTADTARICFVLPRDESPQSPKVDQSAGSEGAEVIRGVHVYDFVKAGHEFGDDAAKAIGYAALISVRPIFEAERVRKLIPERAMGLVQRLKPFVETPPAGVPVSLLGDLRRAYCSAAEGLGRMGIKEGWEQVFHLLEQDLAGINQEADPDDWTAVADMLAQALERAGEQFGNNQLLEQSVEMYREMLRLRVRERVPLNWAKTQNNLGTALQSLGERASGTEMLEQAVLAFRAALQEITRERVPLDWATTQNNLGGALQILGKRTSGTEILEQAVSAYRAALEERTRECVPLDWATTQNNLGAALAELGERAGGTEILEQAVLTFRAALEERTRERVPLEWAATQNNLGTALQRLGERAGGTEMLEQAVEAFRAALEVLETASDDVLLGIVHQNLRIVETMIPERRWREAKPT